MNRSRTSALILVSALGAATLCAQDRYSVVDETASGPDTPAVIVLRDSGGAEAAVTPSKGGEISSYKVKVKDEWVEFIYRARDYASGRGFGGKGPFLWPAVGAQYPVGTVPQTSCGPGPFVVDGKSYTMPCHGFAKNFPWKEVSRSTDRSGAHVTLELTDSKETLAMYPFAFVVDATFTLAAGHLTVDYKVKSPKSNIADMFFSVGNHIAFNIPFLKGSKPEDMTIETPSSEQMLRNTVGVLSGERAPRSFQTPQKLGSFDARVAISLIGYKSQPYVRLVDPQGIALRLMQQASTTLPEPLVRFNLYGGPTTGYFSPEPYFGLQNSLNLKQGAVTLKPGTEWSWRLELGIETPQPPVAASFPGVERVAGDFAYTEGPIWSHDGFLVVSDIYNSRIMKLAPGAAPVIYRNYTMGANGNAFDANGRLYSAERDGRRVSRLEKDGRVTVVADKYEGKRLNAPNDVVVRRDGNVYFTDPASNAVLEPMELDFNGIYRVSPEGMIMLITKHMPHPNGITLSPDGKTLYVADSGERKIYTWDLDAKGVPSNEHVFISDMQGGPDGLRVAVNGNLYIAARGISVYSPAGKLIRTIEFPEAPANCAFGGPDLQTLYVTARTSVYSVRIPDKGSLPY